MSVNIYNADTDSLTRVAGNATQDTVITYKSGSGITKGSDIKSWYSNTRVDRCGKFCNAYFDVAWENKNSAVLSIATLNEAIRPSANIAVNCVTNNGVPLYIYVDASGTVGIRKTASEATTDGIRIPVTYFTA